MKNIAHLLFLVLFISPVIAEEEESIFSFMDEESTQPSKEKLYLSLEGAVSLNTLKAIYKKDLGRTEHALAGVYAVNETIFDDVPMYGKIGVGLSLLFDPRYLMSNVSVSSGIRLPGKLAFYWGVGGLFGEVVECMYCKNESDNNGFVGVFPELGANTSITKNIRVGLFVRNYFLSDNLGSFFVYGGSISFLNE